MPPAIDRCMMVSMVALNDIPESLRERKEDTWTPGRGLVKGAICTLLAALVLGAVMCVVTYYAVPLTTYWVLNGVWGFVLAWMLCAVMHRTSGAATLWGTLIVILCTSLLFGARHVVVAMSFKELNGLLTFFYTSLSLADMVLSNVPALAGIVIAAIMCKDGDSILHDIADMAMANVLTGRRD